MQFYYFDHIPIDDTVYTSRDFDDFPVQWRLQNSKLTMTIIKAIFLDQLAGSDAADDTFCEYYN